MLKVKLSWHFLLIALSISTSIIGQNNDSQTIEDSSKTIKSNTRKYFFRLPQESKANSEDLMKEAIEHFDGGRFNISIEYLNRAIEINEFPQLTDILYFYRGVSKTKIKNYSAALLDYDSAIAIKPNKSNYLYNRGLTYFQIGNYTKAKKDFQKTLIIDGETADIYFKLGFIKQQDKDLKASISDYTKAIELNPEFAEPYYYRGLIYLQVLLPEKSCTDIKKASDLGYLPATQQYNKYCKK
jgi:tetratricopeptide (TPR) repeat protein